MTIKRKIPLKLTGRNYMIIYKLLYYINHKHLYRNRENSNTKSYYLK